MFVSIAGPVQPPNLARRGSRCQRVEHCENRGRSNTGAKQNNGSIGRSKKETAPWCAHVQYVAYLHMTMHVSAGHAVQLLLDTHAIVVCTWRVRERVTAQQRWRIRVRPQAQDDELARLGSD